MIQIYNKQGIIFFIKSQTRETFLPLRVERLLELVVICIRV